MRLKRGDCYLMLETTRLDRMEGQHEREEIVERISGLTKDDVTVILPVLNEEEGVGVVIDEILQNGYRNILVIDGYSTDNTVQAAQRRGVTVIQQHGRGKTGAIRTAIENASTPFLLVMDGDYTYNPDDIERFLAHANGYDQIVGARERKNISKLHQLGNWILCTFFNTLLGTSISDVCSGMYLMKLESAKQLNFRSKGFSVEVEVLAQMALQGNVTEVPVGYRQRIGKAKLSTLVHGFAILRSILSLARLYNPVFLFSTAAASAAIPGLAILLWVLSEWLFRRGLLHSGWALVGMMLLLLSSQAFIVGTIALLLKRTEIRTERLIKRQYGRSL